ncbi:hypothetical protein [Streptomyces sp. CRN 30]|uniref:hypothetical protein n=1 Tax=Streptomyces sp. CRN 30 TaxID=3075613 RepID=UPI002A80968D|nr:hypothetical protein [Streptomyces sp. CRN 30]
MCPAPTQQPSTQRTELRPPTAGPAVLRGLDRIPWAEIQDSSGSAAAVPALLGRVAGDDPEAALAALAELRGRVCQYGFVVEQATAATVPFLWELAQHPGVTCRAQIIRLLKNIADARQWESTAAVYPKLLNHRENPVVWERAARQAVRARRAALERLMADDDTEVTRVTSELARVIGE